VSPAIPASVLRLFPGELEAHLAAPEHAARLILGVLEDGDRDDLHWLLARFGQERVRTVSAGSAGRRLSRRSYALFALLLALPPRPEPPPGRAFWPEA
jgi:hypothetical protein